MTVEERYALLKADYKDAKNRLLKDERIEKYLRKFIEDPSMRELDKAIAAYSDDSTPLQDRREAVFTAAHTLKGVAGNLALTPLFKAASELVEQMRDRRSDPSAPLVENLRDVYSEVLSALAGL